MTMKRLIMHNMPQIVPVSDLRTKHIETFGLLKRGPVVLAQRSRPAAVLVSFEEWDETANELARLRRIVAADRHFAAMKAGDYVDLEDLAKELAAV
jgi:prevent-host-death family protein